MVKYWLVVLVKVGVIGFSVSIVKVCIVWVVIVYKSLVVWLLRWVVEMLVIIMLLNLSFLVR